MLLGPTFPCILNEMTSTKTSCLVGGGVKITEKTFLPRCIECRRGVAMRILSVRQTRVNCDKTKEKSVQIFIPYERSFILVFAKKNGLWGASPTT